MVMRILVYIEVLVGGFPIDFVPKGAVHLPVYVDVQKWELTCFFYFHVELYFVVNPIEVV